MKTRFTRHSAWMPRALWSSLAALVCLAAAPDRAQAQAAASDTAAKLNVKVHLSSGAVTLPQIMQALSAQSGLNIEAADYLRERRLVAQMDGLTVRNALDALAELNDWAWHDRGAGHIVITRLAPPGRQEPSNVPLRMRFALPRDVRVCCNLEPQPARSKKQAGEEDDPFMAEHKSVAVAQEARLHLIDALKPAIFEGAPFPYARMKAGQQEDLLISLLMTAVHQTKHDMLLGQPLTWLDNLADMKLEMNSNTLLITTHGDTGFGVQVTP